MKKVLKHMTWAILLVSSILLVEMDSKAATKAQIKGAKATSVTLGTNFDAKKGVTATDSKGKSVTKKIVVTGNANTNKKGTYYYTYKVKVSSKQTLTVKRKVTVKAKSYTVSKTTRQFDEPKGIGRHAALKKGTKVSLIQKGSAGWYKTSKNYWIKSGFVGDYIYVGKKEKLYASSTSKSTSKYAAYGIHKVTTSSTKANRIKIASGWMANPAFVDDYATKGDEKQQAEILKLVNKERAKHQLKPVVLDETLSKIAIIRSTDMIDGKYFSHTSPKYGPFYTLVQQSNYPYWALGENIAAGASSGSQYMQMWMNSSGHRANILNARYNRIGIGVVKNSKNDFYHSVATQVFAQK